MQYGYARVSTVGQMEGNSLEEQKRAILELYPGAEIVEEAYTGKVADRPEFTKLIDGLQAGDILVVTKLDRFCRNTEEGLAVIKKLQERDIKMHILNMGFIDNTPVGKLLVTFLLAIAEYERAQIIERTQGGKAVAKSKPDFKEGRPACDVEVNQLPGETVKEACLRLGISKTTFYKYR